ncbi:DUF3397 domain-containing protein [Bacillus pinisoli]|uniref:DUF3397 domain-containing protein n=1 Tax=Bacillus pinisoli TaxID=2901866 RepID=UPI001FF3A47D
MSSFFSWIFATVITAPLLGFVVIFTVLRSVLSSKKRAFHYSVDATTLLLMISVYFLGKVIFNITLLTPIIVFTLLIAIIFVFINWKVREEIHIQKVIKGVWRFNFLFFFICHIVLMIWGISSRVWEL